jgi:hypothetical protein
MGFLLLLLAGAIYLKGVNFKIKADFNQDISTNIPFGSS